MLPAYLPSWLQDLSGSVMSSKLIEVMHGSLLPIAVGAPLGLLALLFINRVGTNNGPAAVPAALPKHLVQERSSMPALPSVAPASFTPVQPIAATQPAAPLILVVDDSAVVRAKLSRLLIGADMRVIEACDGHEAWELISRGERPMVVITDLEMPIVDGFELIAALHGAIETEYVPIIAITGHDDLRAQVADLTGIYGIFKKPWNDRELTRRVEMLVAIAAVRTLDDDLSDGIQARGRIAITRY